MCVMAMSWLMACAASAGQPPNNLFIIDSIHLHPGTFEVTLVVNVGNAPSGQTYGVEAHPGPPTSNTVTWTLIGTQVATGSTLTFVDHLSGPLLHPGKTYRGVIGGSVFTVNEGFVGYPRLSNPLVRVSRQSQGAAFAVDYGEGIYSNTVPVTVPDGVTTAFFRMWSPDDDPTNAVIQVRTNTITGDWADCVP
jgi:hypothetical protein